MSSGTKSRGGRVFLIGGGWEETAADVVHGPFLRAARAASGTAGSGSGPAPRILCVLLDEGDGAAQFARYDVALRKAGDCVPVPALVPVGERFETGTVSEDVAGVFVCGGLTPAYQDALAEASGALAALLSERGLPYAGFSAGAALAGRDAVVGGWLVDGVAVCPPDTAEDLEELEVRPGLGLVPFAVENHAAQWGTLGRLAAVVAGGRLAHGVAIDENTLVEVGGEDGDRRARVAGRGRAHSVRPAPGGGVLVRSYGDGESFPVA
ncbi:cyanophycinase [Streptomyces sp. 3330]|uniref:Type 1 glutamine amidotransferase-like domain-containing protein n=1 Tax=Streptomyces sp. 3330 TaxID=2817755 RepID=UPI0028612EB3|nr:Type 1 glutamine amidotransferase-like domain-containing protein [Streptomyces sp. 3330]MDR6975662.1 cyanophycinase [Streptomyces sp. 3330]